MNWLKKFRDNLFPPMEGKPPRIPAHFPLAWLTFLSTAAALWQHGDVHYTLIVTALVLPVSLTMLLPYRFCNNLTRSVLKVLIFAAGCFWCMYRLKHDIPTDKLMVETLALWNLTFLAGTGPKDGFYLFFIDILLLLYGALLPRLLSLYLSIFAAMLILLILFRSRSGLLSGDVLLKTPAGSFRRNWHIKGCYLLLSAVLFYWIFSLLPLTGQSGAEGIFAVSFDTMRESMAPPDLRKWLGEGLKKKNSREGTKESDEAPGEFRKFSKHGRSPMQLKNPPPDVMPLSGKGGGGAMGKDLVFRVRSPLKLYHLAQLYDEYDGRIWHATPRLRRAFLNRNPERTSLYGQIRLKYTVEKWISPKLPAPFAPIEYNLAPGKFLPISSIQSFYGTEIRSKLPPLPFCYEALSEISLPALKQERNSKQDPNWIESLPARWYLKLPPGKISRRVQLLAKALTAQADTPYAKAALLRDFLRKNYPYELHTAPIPERCEPVDYFLFHLQKGHCEYFAAALAVMARSVGLPARVATGFSPGNYNTLTGEFEIYEYHAHAWTQIHIRNVGWLTFDATPPGAVISDTTPIGFGKMRDPFGEEWRTMPPELTAHTVSHIKQVLLKEKKEQNQETGTLEKALGELQSAEEQFREKINEAKAKQPDPRALKNPGLFDLQALRERAALLLKLFQEKLAKFTAYVLSDWLHLVGSALLFAAALAAGARIFRGGVRLYEILRWKTLRARAARFSSPKEAIRSSCQGALQLLYLKEMGRNGNMELLEYARTLRADLIPAAEAIFRIFYASEYRRSLPETGEAEKAFAALLQLEKQLSL